MEISERRNQKLLANWQWPYAGRGELGCPHGAGHGGVHNCDGCCNHPSFDKAKLMRKDQGFKLK